MQQKENLTRTPTPYDCLRVLQCSALQPVCTVHPGVHQNMRGVHHYERVHKGASQICHTKQILFTKLSVSKNEPFNLRMTFRI